MSIIPLTVFLSLLLAGGFVALFVREQRRRKFASAERDSLLPLADETPRLAAAVAGEAHAHDDDHDHAGHDHDHPHGEGGCGCESGVRPPCAGCLRRTGTSIPQSLTPPRPRSTPSP